MRKISAATIALLCSVSFAVAQQATTVQQASSRLDAVTNIAIGTNNNTVNQQSVATITVPSGLYAYITGLNFDMCGDATGTVAANVNFTSSGIVGTPSWSYSATTANSLSTCTRYVENFAVPLKSAAPGTNVVLTSPAALLHTGFSIRAYYYIAP